MQYQWIKWFHGFLVIILTGKRIERLINIAVQQNIQIWNITRFDQERGKIAVRLSDFYRLKPLLKETGCRIRIIGKHGFPFFLTRVKVRYTFFIGFVTFLIMLFLLSNVIWSIEVIGTEKMSKGEILNEAKKIGIQQGKFSFMLDEPDKIQSELMARIPEASWIGFKMDGTKAQIRVVEKVFPNSKETYEPRHLIANKTAVVHAIFAEHGKPVVRPDDLVRKGDILVSGLIGKEESPVAVAAKGKVEGEVWYETDVVVPIQRKQSVYTGEKHRNYYILLGGMQIKLWGFGDISFQQYEVKDNPWKIRWRDKELPIGWKTEDILSVEHKVDVVSPEEAQQLAIEAARRDVISKMGTGGYIKEEKVLLQRKENDKVYIKMHVIAIEDIAVEQPIIFEGE